MNKDTINTILDDGLEADNSGNIRTRRPNTVITDALIKQIAAMASIGSTVAAISKGLDLSRETVTRILDTSECKLAIQDIGDSAIAAVKSKVKQEVAKLGPEIYKVLEYQLKKKKSLHGVTIALKVLGFDDNKEVNAQQTNLTVVLPKMEEKKND